MPQNNGDVVSQDYIDLEFYQEVYPIRVSIFETYSPGSVIGIWAQNSEGKWFQLWSGLPQIVPQKPRLFTPHLHLCNFKTKRIRLEFNHDLLEYYTELDAVFLIGTLELVVPNNNLHSETLDELLQQLGYLEYDTCDPYNLTPDYLTVRRDIKNLKRTFSEHCKLYKSTIIDKGQLVAEMSQFCQCVAPIEEALNILQQFLQGDFLKFTKDIAEKRCPVPLTNLEGQQCNRFSALPDETVLNILKNLDLKSLCRLCRVNRYFNNIARDALLYRYLNLKPYWHCLDTTALSCLATRCQYLQQLDLSWCGNYNMFKYKDFIYFLQSCGTSLTHLRLNCCHFVNDAVILEISKVCKNLKELCLRNCMGITNEGFSKLENLELIERLELYRTIIETSTLCSILRKNTQMRHLNLAGMHGRLNIDEVAIELGNSCPYLESIDFWKAQTLTPHGVRALSHCTKLREVDFGWCNGMNAPGDSLRAFLFSCRCLEKVSLVALRGLTDSDVEPLVLSSQLQQLDLSGICSLTADICSVFLLFCTKLEMIDLSFCERISNDDIQEMRKKYPHVSIKKSFQILDPYIE
ncbi:F box and leucine-rich-repeat gene 4 isoform X2 [Calliopsis andreniformis]